MSFASTLGAYCEALGCPDKVIAARCGLSASTLSRYLRGNRMPEAGGEAIAKLAEGLADLSREYGSCVPFAEDEVRAALEAEIAGTNMVGMDFHMRFDMLMHLTGLRNVNVAEVAGVDPSYVSRIRRGHRMPLNVPRFASACAHLAASTCIENDLLGELGDLVGVDELEEDYPDWDPYDESNIAEIVEVWLMGSQIVQADMAKLDELLDWLDGADLSPWLALGDSSVHVEPVAPPPSARFYYGIGGMRAAEITFLDTAADTHARTLWLSSDMPLKQVSSNPSFIKKYERAITKVLRAGCHVNVFYNVERPLAETIRSLRLWIPLYASGQVSPYYLHGVNNRLFFHMNYASETCALSSEAVVDHEEEGRYYFTTRPEDVSYYQRKMQFILEKASTLLEIYRDCDPGQKQAFEEAEAARQATGRGRDMGKGRFRNLRATSYPGDCTVLTLPCGPTVVHFVIRHPKINYVVAHMK